MFLASHAEKSRAPSSYIASRISYEQHFDAEPQGLSCLSLAMTKTPASYELLPPTSYSCLNRISPLAET